MCIASTYWGLLLSVNSSQNWLSFVVNDCWSTYLTKLGENKSLIECHWKPRLICSGFLFSFFLYFTNVVTQLTLTKHIAPSVVQFQLLVLFWVRFWGWLWVPDPRFQILKKVFQNQTQNQHPIETKTETRYFKLQTRYSSTWSLSTQKCVE